MQLKQIVNKVLIQVLIGILLGFSLGGILFTISYRNKLNTTPATSVSILTTTSAPASTPASTSTIETYLNQGDFQNAYNEALKLQKENPDNAISYKYLGLTLFQIGKYSESNQNFELVLQKSSLTPTEKSEIYYLIARNFQLLKDYDKSNLYSQKAIEANPDDYRPYQLLGQILLKQQKYQEAIFYFSKSLDLIPNSSTNPLSSYPYYYLAQSYLITEKYQQAQEAINKAEKLAQGLNIAVVNSFVSQIQTLKTEIEKKLSS